MTDGEIIGLALSALLEAERAGEFGCPVCDPHQASAPGEGLPSGDPPHRPGCPVALALAAIRARRAGEQQV